MVIEEIIPVPEWTVDTLISHYSQEYGQDEALVRRIIQCESGFKKDAVGKNINKQGVHWSSDYGYFQVNDYYHLEDSLKLSLDVRNDWQDNLMYGFILLKKDGPMRHWSASSYCWNK